MSAHGPALIAKAAKAINAALDDDGASWTDLARAVLNAVADDLRAGALEEAADELLAYSKELREAYRKHNAGRDLSKRPPIRPDIDNWANANEAASHRFRRQATEIRGGVS